MQLSIMNTTLCEMFDSAEHAVFQLNNKKAFSNLVNEVLHNVLFNYERAAEKKSQKMVKYHTTKETNAQWSLEMVLLELCKLIVICVY